MAILYVWLPRKYDRAGGGGIGGGFGWSGGDGGAYVAGVAGVAAAQSACFCFRLLFDEDPPIILKDRGVEGKSRPLIIRFASKHERDDV